MRKIPYILILAIFLPMFFGVAIPLFSAPETALAAPVDSPYVPLTPEQIAAKSAVALADSKKTWEEEQKKEDGANFGLTCWQLLPWPKLDPGACVALFAYYIFWYPTAALLMVAAAVFDTLAAWSFNADILKSTMVSGAWKMLRDLANLTLIFALLYIAIATILQVGGVQLKKAVANVIIVALLINFSLFITEVVIDASNILASSLYDRIGTAMGAPLPSSGPSPAGTALGPTSVGVTQKTGVLQISARIVAAFGPQKFLTKEIVEKWDKARDGKSSLFFVFVFAAIVNIIAAYAFLVAGLLLVARVVMFVFLIISSPIAFAAWALPGGGGGFDKKWWSALVDQALVAPVFFLFLYVITTVYDKDLLGGVLSTPTGAGDFIPFLVSIALHFVVIIVALLIAVNITKKLSGAAGSYATKIGGAVVGGAVLGGAAMAGRAVVGGAATRLAENERFKKIAENSGFVGRGAKAGLDKISGASFDARSIIGSGELGKPRKGASYAGDLKARTAAKEKFADYIEKDKFGNARYGAPDKTLVEEEYEVMRPSPSGAVDNAGNPIMQKVKEKRMIPKEVEVTAKEAYRRKLEKAGRFEFMGKTDWTLLRSSRNAALNIKSGKTTKSSAQEQLDKIKDDVREELKKEMEGGSEKTT